MENFLVHNDETKAQMLADIGMKSIDDLFAQIPEIAVPVDFEKEIGNAKSELEKQLNRLPAKTIFLPKVSWAAAATTNSHRHAFFKPHSAGNF